MQELKEFKVSRKRWLRGEGPDKSFLYRKADKKMCCLGFFCRQIKHLAVKDISVQEPKQLSVPIPELVGLYCTLDWVIDAMAINDDNSISEANREKELKKLFAENSYKIIFED